MLIVRKGHDPSVVVRSKWKAEAFSWREGWKERLIPAEEVPHVDVLIVGAGAVGIFTAFHLLSRPSPPTVAVVDRAISSGAGWNNMGVVSPVPCPQLLRWREWMHAYRQAFDGLSKMIEERLSPLIEGRGERLPTSPSTAKELSRWMEVEESKEREDLLVVKESILLNPHRFMSLTFTLLPRIYLSDGVEVLSAERGSGKWVVSTSRGQMEAEWVVWTGRRAVGYLPLMATLNSVGSAHTFTAPLSLSWAVRETPEGAIVFDYHYPVLGKEITAEGAELVKALATYRLTSFLGKEVVDRGKLIYLWGAPPVCYFHRLSPRGGGDEPLEGGNGGGKLRVGLACGREDSGGDPFRSA